MSKRDLDQLARELMSDPTLPADLKAAALRGTMAARAVLGEFDDQVVSEPPAPDASTPVNDA